MADHSFKELQYYQYPYIEGISTGNRDRGTANHGSRYILYDRPQVAQLAELHVLHEEP
jgi:hypothetical protein